MSIDKEIKKEYDRLRYITNKEKISAQQIKERSSQMKAYKKTPQGIKSRVMYNWRKHGINNVNDEMYVRYINTHCCDICNTEFKNSYDRCLDHDHTTGDFRQVLCRACNLHDAWKKVLEP